MAVFNHAMDALKALEYSKASNVLHHNKGERGYTYFGIYQSAHPKWAGWKEIYRAIVQYKYRLGTASISLYKKRRLTEQVYKFYRTEYWDAMFLDAIKSQKIAEEIFIFAVNTNPKRAIKKAQKIVGVKVDGWIGNKTISALNSYDEKRFDIQFDLAEIAFYKYLAFASPKQAQYKRFYKGWVKRARAV